MEGNRGPRRTPRGRGTGIDPANRFTRLALDPDTETPAPARARTVYPEDRSRSIVTRNSSPDLPFEASLNPYRGCEHGCAYCYARRFHEYLGFSAGLEFETRIVVKPRAPELLARTLGTRGYRPVPLDLSGVTDPYQPVERRLGLTRACLEVLARARHPVIVVTKNAAVVRDLDLLRELARHRAVRVTLSITTLDARLAHRLEPRTSSPRQRLDAVRTLAAAGVPVSVLVAPVIPGLTDHEVPAIVAAAAEAGAVSAAWAPLRLPEPVDGIFTAWLEEHEPLRRDRVLARLRAIRDGRLDDAAFGSRFTARGPLGAMIGAMFEAARRRAGLPSDPPPLETGAFRPPGGLQLSLFGG